MSEVLSYPLHWPAGWKRTSAILRKSGQFGGSLDAVRKALLEEIDRIALGPEARTYTITRSVIISTNLPLRADGFPRAGAKEPEDPGVAVYFTRKKQPLCFACDKYDRVWKNMRAIQKTIEAMRGIERWGSSSMLERAFTGFAALPERRSDSPWDILGVSVEAGEAEIMKAWREKAKVAHPDAGGSHEAMSELNRAKDIALETLRNTH